MNNYLLKRLFIIEEESKHLISLSNDTKLIIHVIDQLETDFTMSKNREISSVEDTKNIAYSD